MAAPYVFNPRTAAARPRPPSYRAAAIARENLFLSLFTLGLGGGVIVAGLVIFAVVVNALFASI